MTSSLRPKSRLFCVLFLSFAGCAVAASRDEDLSLPDDGADEIARSVLPDGSLDDAGATHAQTQPLLDDASTASAAEAGAHDAGAPYDAGAHDAGDGAVHDASSHDAAADASASPSDAASGGSCVASQCNVSCLTRACCSVLDQCACEDLVGLCIIPAL